MGKVIKITETQLKEVLKSVISEQRVYPPSLGNPYDAAKAYGVNLKPQPKPQPKPQEPEKIYGYNSPYNPYSPNYNPPKPQPKPQPQAPVKDKYDYLQPPFDFNKWRENMYLPDNKGQGQGQGYPVNPNPPKPAQQWRRNENFPLKPWDVSSKISVIQKGMNLPPVQQKGYFGNITLNKIKQDMGLDISKGIDEPTYNKILSFYGVDSTGNKLPTARMGTEDDYLNQLKPIQPRAAQLQAPKQNLMPRK